MDRVHEPARKKSGESYPQSCPNALYSIQFLLDFTADLHGPRATVGSACAKANPESGAASHFCGFAHLVGMSGLGTGGGVGLGCGVVAEVIALPLYLPSVLLSISQGETRFDRRRYPNLMYTEAAPRQTISQLCMIVWRCR